MEDGWEDLELALGSEDLDAGDDGDIDARFPACINKAEEGGVVKEHLGNDERSTGVNFPLEIHNIAGHVAGLSVHLWISGNTNLEIGGPSILDAFQIIPLVEAHDVLYELVGMSIPLWMRYEMGVVFVCVAPKSKDVLEAQIIEFNQIIL